MNSVPRTSRSFAGRFTGTAALALLIAAGTLLMPVASAEAAADDVSWTVRTASNEYGAERTSYTYSVSPGSTVTDALVVANHGTTPIDLGVYGADGFTTESGEFDLVVGGAKSVGVGAFVHDDSTSITVAPGATTQFPFTLTVPKNATPGDYAGGIVTSLVQPDAAQGINVDRRLGIRIALRVSGDLKPALAIENPHLGWNGGLNPFAGGDATMTYTIHNTGNAALSATQAATVAGPFGLLAKDAAALKKVPLLLPGEKWTVTARVPDVAALLVLTGTTTVTPVVVDASGSTNTLAPVAVSTSGAAIPWMLLVILLVIAALVVLAIRRRRRTAADRTAQEDARVQAAVESALAEAESAAEAQESVH